MDKPFLCCSAILCREITKYRVKRSFRQNNPATSVLSRLNLTLPANGLIPLLKRAHPFQLLTIVNIICKLEGNQRQKGA